MFKAVAAQVAKGFFLGRIASKDTNQPFARHQWGADGAPQGRREEAGDLSDVERGVRID